jgi:FKBP-type peptidyl-prolyl cis-trans isomerase 2
MELKKNDFIELEFDLYANDKLVQSTNEKVGKEAGLKQEKYEPSVIVVGHEFMLKALDEDLVKGKQEGKRTLEVKSKDAYGPRKKDMIKVFPKSAFDEHKMRPVVGVVYDFNGMFGLVKSIVGGRVMVDFNNPLAGKDVKVEYNVKSKIEAIDKKVAYVLELVFKVPTNMFNVKVKDKDVTLELPEQLAPLKDEFVKGIENYAPEIKNYSVKIENFKKQ